MQERYPKCFPYKSSCYKFYNHARYICNNLVPKPTMSDPSTIECLESEVGSLNQGHERLRKEMQEMFLEMTSRFDYQLELIAM